MVIWDGEDNLGNSRFPVPPRKVGCGRKRYSFAPVCYGGGAGEIENNISGKALDDTSRETETPS
jgi:hypothetical protein